MGESRAVTFHPGEKQTHTARKRKEFHNGLLWPGASETLTTGGIRLTPLKAISLLMSGIAIFSGIHLDGTGRPHLGRHSEGVGQIPKLLSKLCRTHQLPLNNLVGSLELVEDPDHPDHITIELEERRGGLENVDSCPDSQRALRCLTPLVHRRPSHSNSNILGSFTYPTDPAPELTEGGVELLNSSRNLVGLTSWQQTKSHDLDGQQRRSGVAPYRTLLCTRLSRTTGRRMVCKECERH